MKRCPSQTEKDGENFNFPEVRRESSFNQKGGFILHTCHVFRTRDQGLPQSKGRLKPVLDTKPSGNVCSMFLQGEEEYLPKTGGGTN